MASALVDPNSFPIFKQYRQKSFDFQSIWDYKPDIKQSFLEDVGHVLEVKESLIDHPTSNLGVFVKTFENQTLKPGTLLGLYPGVFCEYYKEIDESYPTIARSDGTMLKYLEPLQIEYQNKATAVKGQDVNPVSCAHFCNHPPFDTCANAALIDIFIPKFFFPKQYLSYLPNQQVELKYETLNKVNTTFQS